MTGIDPDHFELPFECGALLVLAFLALFIIAWGAASLYRLIAGRRRLEHDPRKEDT